MIGLLLYKFCRFLSVNFPLKCVYKFSERISYIYYLLDSTTRNVVFDNLTHVFGKNITPGEKKTLTIRIFKNFAKGLVDFCRFSKVDRNFIKKYVEIKNLHYIDEALKKGGVIALTGHIGCWELGGVVLSILGYPLNAVAKPHTREAVENFFLKQRNIKGVKVIPVGRAYKQSYKRLMSNQIVALLADRRYGGIGIKVKCFNKTVIIPKGPAVLSLRTNSAIVSGYMIRRKNGCFSLIFEKPIYPREIVEKDRTKKRYLLAQNYITTMQKYIEQYPEQWSLFHKLFVE